MLVCLQLDDGHCRRAQLPFPRLVASDALREDARAELLEGFPRYRGAGFFPHLARDCGHGLNQLVDELSAPAFGEWIGARLGLAELRQLPTLVTLCRSLNARHGTIHTDSRSKVASALLYLNPQWPHGSAGCLRLLARIDDIDSMLEPEIAPLYGNVVAFRRSDCSFHGHLPYAGERLVIQVAWLVSEAEKQRKLQRGGFARRIKGLLSKLDRRLGSGRDRSQSHRD